MHSIPKIIHYCWFGNTEKSYLIQECMNSWVKLKDYQFILWDESNCDLDENPYIRKCYDEKQYAFVSDYFRLKALYNMGGIYLDTDVFVRRSFDDLLDNEMFVGFMFKNAFGTAVIGARKGNPFIKRLLDSYDCLDTPTVNNGLLTDELKNCFHNVTLDGRKQFLKDANYGTVAIFKMQEFENGYIFKKGHTVHLSAGSWWRRDANQYSKIKVTMTKVPIIHVISILKLIISIRQTWRIRRGR